MAKSLTDLLKSKASTSQQTTQQSSIPTDLYEYVGSDTNDLYVIGHKGNVPVKIKVRANSCCDGIDLGNNTPGGGGGETPTVNGIKKGASFSTFNALYTAYKGSLLEANTVYDVSDKGTIEQYIYSVNENGASTLHQISGNFNMIVSDPGAGRSACTLELNKGVLQYNLPELVIGDYLFKGWSEMTAFISDTPSLVSGKQMFKNTSLTTFCGELSALEDGEEMFGTGVKLDYDSILNIVDSIKDVKGIAGTHRIHIGYNSGDSEFIAEKNSLTSELTNKGWSVIWLEDGV
jgi:hypothetical protein